MSADEIRRLAQQIYCDGISVKSGGFNDMSGRLHKCFNALLEFAGIVERCERLKFNMIPHKHDTEIVDYILKGAKDERK